jgi:hypothetical protein
MAINMFSNKIGTNTMNIAKTVLLTAG